MTERLLVEGIENSSIDHLLSLVKISLLGPHWERLVLDKWQGVRMVENESVFRFHQYGDDHWKWHVSGGPVLGANENKGILLSEV